MWSTQFFVTFATLCSLFSIGRNSFISFVIVIQKINLQRCIYFSMNSVNIYDTYPTHCFANIFFSLYNFIYLHVDAATSIVHNQLSVVACWKVFFCQSKIAAWRMHTKHSSTTTHHSQTTFNYFNDNRAIRKKNTSK